MTKHISCGALFLAFGFLAVPARADLKVSQRADVVFLHDGTRVVGTILAEGIKAVVLLIDGQERLVRRELVLRIEKGPEVGKRVEGFTADPVNGLKVARSFLLDAHCAANASATRNRISCARGAVNRPWNDERARLSPVMSW